MYSNMKKSFLALASLAAIAVACQVEKMDELPLVDNSVVYTASTEAYAPATKTAMDGLDVVWSENDYLAVFQGKTIADKFVVSSGIGETLADFILSGSEAVGENEFDFNVAVYPHSEDVEFGEYVEQQGGWPGVLSLDDDMNSEESVTYELSGLTLPSTQEYTPGTFAEGTFPMVAVTESLDDDEFCFRNLLGVMKLQLKGTKNIKAIKVSGNNGEALSGTYTVRIVPGAAPELVMGDSKPAVTLDCGDGVQLNATTATDFYIALPPADFTKGFTVNFVDDQEKLYQLKATAANTLKRSSVLAMQEINVDDLAVEVQTSVFKTEASMTEVQLEIAFNAPDVIGFYGCFIPDVDMWDNIVYPALQNGDPMSGGITVSDFLSGMYADMMPMQTYGSYNGKLSEFGWSSEMLANEQYNILSPVTSYYVVIVPIIEGKVEYTLDDFDIKSVATSTPEAGGTAKLPTPEITIDYKGCAVVFDPSEDVEYVRYLILKDTDEQLEESEYMEALFSEGSYDAYYDSEYGCEIGVDNAYGVLPGTGYELYVMYLGVDGKAAFDRFDVNTKPIPYDDALTVSVETPEYNGVDNLIETTVTYTADAVELYYMVTTQNTMTDYNASENIVGILSGYPSSSITVVELDPSSTSVEISKAPQRKNADNYVHVVVKNAEGKFSHFVTSAACRATTAQ